MTNAHDEANEFITGGAVAVKFPKQGFVWGGTILSWEMAQQTDMESGEPKTWADGRPMKQLILTMQGEATGITWEGIAYNEVEIDDDDGIRRLFVKGQLQSAVKAAVRNAKAGGLEVGAYLEVTRGKDLPPKKKGWGGAHTFSAVWTPAAQNPKAVDILNDDDGEDPFGD